MVEAHSRPWKRAAAALIAAALLSGQAQPAEAQVAWDAPFFVPPRAGTGWGLALLDPAPGDLGVLGFWRGRSGTIGLRGGLAERGDDELSAFAGIDWAGPLVRRSSDFPLDLDWIIGAGLSAGDEILLSFPFGVTLGAAFAAESVAFGPYLSPRLVLDAWTGDDRPPNDRPGRRRDRLDLELAVDLGLDVAFDPGWTLRFGATLGDRDALAIGVSIH